MNNGYIKLHRKILEWEWYTEPNTMRLFLHCLLKANHKDKNWRGTIVKRGTFITSIKSLSKETGLSNSQARTSLKRLLNSKQISIQSTNRSSLISIVKYDMYQGNDNPDSKQIANESQTDRKQIATTKNDKNDKNENNNTLSGDFLTAEATMNLNEMANVLINGHYQITEAHRGSILIKLKNYPVEVRVSAINDLLVNYAGENFPIKNPPVERLGVYLSSANRRYDEERQKQYNNDPYVINGVVCSPM